MTDSAAPVSAELQQLLTALNELADSEKAGHQLRFFKTGEGQYGAGDRFIGVKIPLQRELAQKWGNQLSFSDLSRLLASAIHEHRMTALLILVRRMERGKSATEREETARFYLEHLDGVNNWDLVDTSAHKIVGRWLYESGEDRVLLYRLAAEDDLWRQRVAVMSTFWFIRQGDYDDTLKLSEILLSHPHDLIHKAVGWMLREIGNRSLDAECRFLDRYAPEMPRTMLRYAIEKFPADLRARYF